MMDNTSVMIFEIEHAMLDFWISELVSFQKMSAGVFHAILIVTSIDMNDIGRIQYS